MFYLALFLVQTLIARGNLRLCVLMTITNGKEQDVGGSGSAVHVGCLQTWKCWVWWKRYKCSPFTIIGEATFKL